MSTNLPAKIGIVRIISKFCWNSRLSCANTALTKAKEMTGVMNILSDKIDSAPKSVAESIYRRLRSDIIWGKLAPGSPLRSNDLRERYDVGISPLREALSRLASERLVTSSAQRGFRVAPIRVESVVDVTETRLVIEGAALKRSIEIGDVAWESKLVAAHHALSRVADPTSQGPDAEVWTAHHKAFHMALIAGCASEWQLYLADLLFDQAERFRILPKVKTTSAGSKRDPAKEHQQIVDAALNGDVGGAVRALEDHYRATMHLALESLDSWRKGHDG